MIYEDVITEKVPCLLCGEIRHQALFKGRDLLHGLPGEYFVVKCINCGFMQTNPRPNAESIAFYYPDDYGPYHIDSTPLNLCRPISLRRRLRNILFFGREFNSYYHAIPTGQVKIGRALEVGCSTGVYLDELVGAGWEVEGIEFSSVAAEKASKKGHKVFLGSLEQASDPQEKFDLIVGWMVLEHLHHPRQCLAKLCGWIEDDGWLVLSVPNCGSFGWSLFKQYEYGAQIPTHLSHFTPKTITLMLEQSGWEAKRVIHQRLLGSIAGSLGLFLKEKLGLNCSFVYGLINYDSYFSKVHTLLFPLSALLAFFGQTGRMTVWAKKRKIDD